MEKIYVAELMRITKWCDGGISACSKTSGFDSIDDAKKWIKENIYIDMIGVYGYEMHLLEGIIESVENAEVGKWYPYAHSDDESFIHARYTFSITERRI